MKHVRSIVVAGGGSSGWMAAAFLSKTFPGLTITLVESKKTPKIGVGEATTPIVNRLMETLGFKRYNDWLPLCNGTIKTGILFEDWHHLGDSYWHPFELLDYLSGDQLHVGHSWLHQHQSGHPQYRSRASFFAENFLTTRLNGEENLQPVISTFAYHIDAELFQEVLRKSSPQVTHYQDEILDVTLDQHGDIASLKLEEYGDLPGDLFIDCTGFRRLLIGKVSAKSSFESYAGQLFCDRAVVLRFPYSESTREREMAPYVRAEATSAGWIWTIPLFNRLSSGYVYSSSFQRDDEAEQELRQRWGEDRVRGITAAKIKFESGKLERVWEKNCVAIGLCAGFVEPLESTGLAITQLGIELLGSVLDARYYDDKTVDRYNSQVQKLCDDIHEFMTIHYSLSKRDDSAFWRAVQADMKIPYSLAARLETFSEHLPNLRTKSLEEYWFFRDVSWLSVLIGMDFPFKRQHVSSVYLEKAEEIARKRRSVIERKRPQLVSHYQFLRTHLYGEKQRSIHMTASNWLATNQTRVSIR